MFIQIYIIVIQISRSKMGCANSQSIQVANSSQPQEVKLVPVKRENYSFEGLEELSKEIEAQSLLPGKLNHRQVEEKCRIVLDLIGTLNEKFLEDELITKIKMRETLDYLDAASVSQMKSARRFVDIITLTLDAISILFSMRLCPVEIVEVQLSRTIAINFWKSSIDQSGKYILGPSFDFLKKLKTFNEESINEETIELLEPLMSEENFNEMNAGKYSKALSIIVKWERLLWELLSSPYRSKREQIRKKRIQISKTKEWIESWMKDNVREVYFEYLERKYGKIYVETVKRGKKECSICLNDQILKESDFVITKCGHTFHSQCIFQWLITKQQCPYDRKPLNTEFVFPFPDLNKKEIMSKQERY